MLIRGVTGDVVPLAAGGVVVGLLPIASYQAQSVVLEPGDLLLAYTDGISEAMTVNDEEWGEDRMLATASTIRSGAAQDVLNAVFLAADLFTASAPQHDDMTLLVMKLSPA